jgi:hypothetical protein
VTVPRPNAIFDAIESICQVNRHNAYVSVCFFRCSDVKLRDFINLLNHLDTASGVGQATPLNLPQKIFHSARSDHPTAREVELSNRMPLIRRSAKVVSHCFPIFLSSNTFVQHATISHLWDGILFGNNAEKRFQVSE